MYQLGAMTRAPRLTFANARGSTSQHLDWVVYTRRAGRSIDRSTPGQASTHRQRRDDRGQTDTANKKAGAQAGRPHPQRVRSLDGT